VNTSVLPFADPLAACEYLHSLPPPLYAICDAARNPEALSLLNAENTATWSLFDGSAGAALAGVAPYLTRLGRESGLLARLLYLGWGQDTIVLAASEAPPEALRRHLRGLLMVRHGGERFYFRFYDGRVLRLLLPLIEPAQEAAVFGCMSGLLVPGPELLVAAPDSQAPAPSWS
jgi:hypothetical protein